FDPPSRTEGRLMIKHTSIASSVITAVSVALCTLAPARAASATDDKKPIAQSPALNDEYRLSSGDKLRIEVYKDAQMSQSVQIRPDGKITLPLVGDLEATGRTPIELRDTITRQLKEYMTNPVVTVIVVEASAPIAYVMGEVNHPGAVT